MFTIVYAVVYFASYTIERKGKLYNSVFSVYTVRIFLAVIHSYTMLCVVIQWRILHRITQA